MFFFFFFNDTATTEIYTLSLHDALPITSMKRLRPRQEHVQKEVRKAMDYFQTNKERMRYAQFRSQGLFVGSGVVEAGCNAGNIVTRSLPLKAAPGFISTGICPA